MPYTFPWLILPDLQGSVKRSKGNSENCHCSLFVYKYTYVVYIDSFDFDIQWVKIDLYTCPFQVKSIGIIRTIAIPLRHSHMNQLRSEEKNKKERKRDSKDIVQ